MATEVIMPQMGFDMKEGTVVRWLKNEGSPVKKGEPIAEIETDKATVELEAFATGVLRKVFVKEGVKVPVGQVIGVIAQPDEALPRANGPSVAPTKESGRQPIEAVQTPASASAERVAASPMARKLAEDLHVDLAQVKGSGPGGRVTREDVEAFADKKQSPAPAEVVPNLVAVEPAMSAPQSKMRQAIASAMSRSKREIPHFYVTAEVDMTEALKLRQQLNKAFQDSTHITINDLIVKAAAKAVTKYPKFNASYAETGIQEHKETNVGVAIALPEGLIAPAILDCANKTLADIARASKSLGERAKGGTLRNQEYTGATFTVTNLGMFDVYEFSAIINPPQSASLAIGSVRKQPVVKDGQVVVADVMKATLSIDHRVADGAEAAQFLAEVKTLLENPVRLLI